MEDHSLGRQQARRSTVLSRVDCSLIELIVLIIFTICSGFIGHSRGNLVTISDFCVFRFATSS